jgi:hypothetical protein|uniref:Uncharacterized protein n=1 Tax=viral metagenome TaxID=1070528 RepID=A0A6C0IXC0_9ZZZZ
MNIDDQVNFYRILPLIIPFVAPQSFATWFARFYAIKSTTEFYLWARKTYLQHYYLVHTVQRSNLATKTAKAAAKLVWKGAKVGFRVTKQATRYAIHKLLQ